MRHGSTLGFFWSHFGGKYGHIGDARVYFGALPLHLGILWWHFGGTFRALGGILPAFWWYFREAWGYLRTVSVSCESVLEAPGPVLDALGSILKAPGAVLGDTWNHNNTKMLQKSGNLKIPYRKYIFLVTPRARLGCLGSAFGRTPYRRVGHSPATGPASGPPEPASGSILDHFGVTLDHLKSCWVPFCLLRVILVLVWI